MKNKVIFRLMADAISKAERSVMRDFGEILHLQNSTKSISQFVSKSYIRSQEIMTNFLEYSRPEIGFISKHLTNKKEDNWILFPIISLKNFSHGLSNFGIGVGYERAGDLKSCIIRMPYIKDSFFAEKNNGAWSENLFTSGTVRLKVSSRSNKDDYIIIDNNHDNILIKASLLASGRIDGLIDSNISSLEKRLAKLLIKQSGGIIEDIGEKYKATNGVVSI